MITRPGEANEAARRTPPRCHLAADVAGYSRLMGADEEGTHARLRALFREVVDPTASKHHGRIVKNTGDGILVEFASVIDAMRCAVAMQQEVAERNTRPSRSVPVIERSGDHVHPRPGAEPIRTGLLQL